MKKLLCMLLPIVTLSPLTYAHTTHESVKLRENESERIKSCTRLLPDGHEYLIDIKVAVDKKSPDKQDKITRELNISDETSQPVSQDRQEQVKPFLQCMIDNVL
ncbi:hypothetical protein ACL2XG_13885 [Sodalis sp. RH24]|uniref:hypothetical protein n=1 Tax=unclassified Sodalis (in: enterobacteria) TaxID=2636512 RepID=UPI003965A418